MTRSFVECREISEFRQKPATLLAEMCRWSDVFSIDLNSLQTVSVVLWPFYFVANRLKCSYEFDIKGHVPERQNVFPAGTVWRYFSYLPRTVRKLL